MITWLIALAIAVVALWPPTKKQADFLPDALKPKTGGPSYIEAVEALQVVRSRLNATDQLDQPSSDACNVLMLGLVQGSNDE